jgi:transposase
MVGIFHMGFVQGESRQQAALFPVCIEELVPAEHLVRVIDAWVSTLSMGRLGFVKASPKSTGRPPYDPADLLKLYLYGYLNQVRSSRRLERECQRNIEVLWLLNRLAPDFKTIANFRRENGAALAAVCRTFVCFCRGEQLISGELVAIDGSKFQAVASKKQVVSRRQLARELAAIDADIARYLGQLEVADRGDEQAPAPDNEALRQTLTKLQDKRANVATMTEMLAEMGAEHYVVGEGEARLMRTAQGPTRVAYNVQSAVDAEHSLILHHEISQDAADNRQLEPMAVAAKAVLERTTLTVVADAGYSNGEQLSACDANGITAFVAPNRGINNRGDGQLFQKDRFRFDAAQDCYRCPAGETLTRLRPMKKRRMMIYAATACGACALKPQCTQAKQRWLTRHFDEAALERAQARVAADPHMLRRRRAIAEHPFGTLKERILGNGRLLLRGLRGARTEMALAVLAYNFKRVANILGPAGMARAVTA